MMEPYHAAPAIEAELRQLVESWNETLRAAGAGSAELALGLVIRLGFLPVLGIAIILLVFKVVNVILAFVFFVIISLVLLGVSTLVSERARRNAMQQVYHSQVEPEITQFMLRHGLHRDQFDALVRPLLFAAGALVNFLAMAKPKTPGTPQEHG
jgi:hypothetical protein